MPNKFGSLLHCGYVVVDKGRATYVTHPDLCKALDAVLHDIPVSKLDRHRFDTWTTWWIRNWPDGCSQRIGVSEFNVQVGNSDEWCLSLSIGTGAVKNLCQQHGQWKQAYPQQIC